MSSTTHVKVPSNVSSWNSGFTLQPNSVYCIVPTASTFTIDAGRTHNDYHGIGEMDGSLLVIPGKVRLAGLAVFVTHVGAPIEILTFPPGKYFAEVAIGPQGGGIAFVVCDLPQSYSDNSGTCDIDVIETDQPHALMIGAMLNSLSALGQHQFVLAAGSCGMDVAVAAAFGAAAGAPGGPIWMTAGAIGAAGLMSYSSEDCKKLSEGLVKAAEGVLPSGSAQTIPDGGEGSGEDVGGDTGGAIGSGTGGGGSGDHGDGSGTGGDDGGDHDDHDHGDDGGDHDHGDEGGGHDHGDGLIGTSGRLRLQKPRTAKVAEDGDLPALIKAFGDACKEIVMAWKSAAK